MRLVGGLGTEVEPNSEAVPQGARTGDKVPPLPWELAEALQSKGGKPEKVGDGRRCLTDQLLGEAPEVTARGLDPLCCLLILLRTCFLDFPGAGSAHPHSPSRFLSPRGFSSKVCLRPPLSASQGGGTGAGQMVGLKEGRRASCCGSPRVRAQKGLWGQMEGSGAKPLE